MRKLALVFALSFVFAAAVLAQGAQGAPTAPVFMPSGDMKWTDLDPTGAPGVKIADLWGDHTKGAFGALVKFPAGFMTPVHTHTNPFKIVIVSGTFLQTPEGKSEVKLGPGSYLLQPGGNYRHMTGCDKGSDCVFFTQAEGKFDLIPAAPPKK
jgi:anti-sigma factor ChrR (cupin superfamily)